MLTSGGQLSNDVLCLQGKHLGLRDFLKRRREEPSTGQGEKRPEKHPRELRDAWLAFETDYPDRALQLAEPHLHSSNPDLAVDAKKLVALIHFRRRDYATALPLFRAVVTTHDDAGNWFNVCTAATLGGDIELGEQAFQQALAAQQRGAVSDGLSIPFMRQYYACALRDRGEFSKALIQIEELRSIYEHLKITDDTFVYIRGVPFLSHTMETAIDVFRRLGESTVWQRWIDSFAEKLDDEGREYLGSIKQRLANGTEPGAAADGGRDSRSS